jgi:hypothetical protein
LCSSCEYTQWGYWGGAVTSSISGGRTDLGHLNFWVAGQQIPYVNLPATGTGAYAGNMIGSVNNSGSQYTATGNFGLNYNFANSSSNFVINTFDGQGPITVPVGLGGSAAYTGSGASGGISTRITGGFFGPSTGAIPPETAGNFSIINSGAGYQAAGIFQGHN